MVCSAFGCRCPICNVPCGAITGTHLKYKHNNMTREEFKKQYPEYAAFLDNPFVRTKPRKEVN